LPKLQKGVIRQHWEKRTRANLWTAYGSSQFFLTSLLSSIYFYIILSENSFSLRKSLFLFRFPSDVSINLFSAKEFCVLFFMWKECLAWRSIVFAFYAPLRPFAVQNLYRAVLWLTMLEYCTLFHLFSPFFFYFCHLMPLPPN